MARQIAQHVTFDGCEFTIYTDEDTQFHTVDGFRSAASVGGAPRWQDLGPAASLDDARALCQQAARQTPRTGLSGEVR